MSRINILIADSDEQYIDALCKYLMENYSDRLNIIAFTDKLLLEDYIKESLSKTDIQLVSNKMLCEALTQANSRLVFFTDSRTNKTYDGISIFKFQSAESIASEIFNAFSKHSVKEIDIKSGSHKCTVISVYSPAGGSGKSSAAVALGKCLTKKGYNAFYLNLETAPSTLDFFDCEPISSLSSILYSIKDNSRNLLLKLETAINIDSASGVSFIAPGESPIEIEELNPEEINKLIDQIKLLGKFDYIIIDMSSSQNAFNIEVMKESDVILTICDMGSIAKSKLRTLYRLFEIINQREYVNLSEKNILIINKNDKGQINEQLSFNIAKTVFSLPYSGAVDPRIITDELSGFMDSLVLRL